MGDAAAVGADSSRPAPIDRPRGMTAFICYLALYYFACPEFFVAL